MKTNIKYIKKILLGKNEKNEEEKMAKVGLSQSYVAIFIIFKFKDIVNSHIKNPNTYT